MKNTTTHSRAKKTKGLATATTLVACLYLLAPAGIRAAVSATNAFTGAASGAIGSGSDLATAANWSFGSVPSSSSAGGTNLILSTTASSLTWSAGTQSYGTWNVTNGRTYSIAGTNGLRNFSDVTQISNSYAAANGGDVRDFFFVKGSSTLSLGGKLQPTVSLGAPVANFDVQDTSTLNFYGYITNSSAEGTAGSAPNYTKTGTGTLVMNTGGGGTAQNGSNNIRGGFTINAGTVVLGTNDALYGGGSTTLTLNGGTLDIAGKSQSGFGGINGTGGIITNSVSGTTTSLAISQGSGSYGPFTNNASIRGNINVTKSGSSIQVLNASNNYTGGTAITAGTLSLSNAYGLGSSTGLLTNGGTLNLGGFTVSSGAYTMTNGTLTNGTLNSPSYTFSSATPNSINIAATLASNTPVSFTFVNATLYQTGTFNSGSSLYVTNASVALGGIENVSSLTMSGGNFTFSPGYSITNSGAFNQTGAGTISINAGTYSAGNNVLISNSSVTGGLTSFTLTGAGVNNVTVAYGSTTTVGRTTYGLLTIGNALDLVVGGGAWNLLWTGASNNVWDTVSTNWQTNPTTTPQTNVALFAGDNVNFNNSATNATITVTNTGVSVGSMVITNGSGTVVIGGTGNITNTSFIVNGGGNAVISNSVIAQGGIQVTNGSTLNLWGANTITGSTTNSGGTIVLNNASALGTNRIYLDGGNISVTNTTITSFGNTMTVLAGGGTITTASGVGLTWSGPSAIAAAGTTLTKAGPGSLTIGAFGNNFVGALDIQGGSVTQSVNSTTRYNSGVNIGANSSFLGGGFNGTIPLLTGSGTLSGFGILTNNTTNSETFDGYITSVTQFLKAGVGTLTTTGLSNSFTALSNNTGQLNLNGAGTTTVSGTLANVGGGTVNVNSTVNVSTLSNNASTVSGTGTLSASTEVISSAAGTISASVAGAGSLTIKSGTLSLNGSNSYTGQTYIGSSAALVLGNNNALGGSTFMTNTNGTLDLNGKSVSGVSMELNHGTLTNSSASSASWAGGIILDPTNATIALGNGNLTLGGAITGGVTGNAGIYALNYSGPGTLTLSGNDTFTGGTRVSTGQLNVSGSLLGSDTVTLASSAVLNLTGAGTVGNIVATSSTSAQIILGSSAANGGIVAGSTVLNHGTLDLAGASVGAIPLALTNGVITNSSTSSASWSGNIDLQQTNSTISLENGSVTLSGAITNGSTTQGSGTYSLTKSGAGTLTLSGVDTYTGGTRITAGLLNVTGSLLGSDTVTVNSGGQLSGTGSVGNVVLTGTAALTPSLGNNRAVLTLASLAINSSTATTTLDLENINQAAGTGYDQIVINGGALAYNGTLNITSTQTLAQLFGGASQSVVLFSGMSTPTGDLTAVEFNAGATWTETATSSGIFTYTDGVNTYSFTDATGTLAATAVPEPGTCAMVGLGLSALAVTIIRRRRND
jgi:autotransporter-associated beta strand protein